MNPSPPLQKIYIGRELTLAELKAEVAAGSRFLVFSYCISLFLVVSLRRFSTAFLVAPNTSHRSISWRYNILTLAFGWWGLPYGPIFSIRALRINAMGGIDATEDVMLNIDKESLQNREVCLQKTNQWFCAPAKWDERAIRLALKKPFAKDVNVRKIMAAVLINTPEGYLPPITIGLQVDDSFDYYCQRVRESLYTYFRQDTHFEFVDLYSPDPIIALFKKQAITIYEHPAAHKARHSYSLNTFL